MQWKPMKEYQAPAYLAKAATLLAATTLLNGCGNLPVTTAVQYNYTDYNSTNHNRNERSGSNSTGNNDFHTTCYNYHNRSHV